MTVAELDYYGGVPRKLADLAKSNEGIEKELQALNEHLLKIISLMEIAIEK